MKKNSLFFALALLILVACGKSDKAEKNTEQSEKSKTTEKSAEKETTEKSSEKTGEDKYAPETKEALALHNSKFKPKMKDKDIIDLLQGSWDLSAEIDPAGGKTKPQINQQLIIKGENAKITCMNCKDNSHKLVDVFLVLSQKLIAEENILQGLILQVHTDEKDGGGNPITIAMPYGISKLTEDEFVLDYVGGEGGKAIYTRSK